MYDYTGNRWSHGKVTLSLKINLKAIPGKLTTSILTSTEKPHFVV
jgi:hypothetical protein